MKDLSIRSIRHLAHLALGGLLLTVAGTAVASASVSGQEGQEGQEGEDDEKPPLEELFNGPRGTDPQQEMLELIQRVERNLRTIDVLLNDAGAGDLPLEAAADSGLDDLLRDTRSNAGQVVEDIDRLLEIARQQGGSVSSSMQGEQPKPGESPLDEPRDGSPQGREETPDAPQPEEQEQPGGQGERPQSPEEANDPGATRPGGARDSEAGAPVDVIQDAEEWGMLPERMRELFRNEGRDDLPVQYRDWIDAYYRRLNQEP